jgi:hypothetical protein
VPRFGPLGLRKRTQRGRPTIESGLTLTLSKLFAMGSFGLDAPGVPSQAKALFQMPLRVGDGRPITAQRHSGG